MAVQSLQYNSFLGGEVSPRLQYRTDMEKFGKWFKTAENIRFNTIGSFENRPGFIKIADTKNNIEGEEIKLLSFSFNDEESYLLEMTNDYVRFYKNGKQVLVNNEPYEIKNVLTIDNTTDLKYAQAGDIIFICDGKNPLQELRRLRDDDGGFEWEFKEFNFNDGCVPLDEENDIASQTIDISTNPSQEEAFTSFDFNLSYKMDYPYFKGLKLTFKLNNKIINIIDTNLCFFSLKAVADYITNNNARNIVVTAYASEKRLNFQYGGGESLTEATLTTITSINTANVIEYSTRENDVTIKDLEKTTIKISNIGISVLPSKLELPEEIVNIYKEKNLYINLQTFDGIETEDVTTLIVNDFNRKLMNLTKNNYYIDISNSDTLQIRKTNFASSIPGWKMFAVPLNNQNSIKKATKQFGYVATSSFDFWSDKKEGEVFAIRHNVAGEGVRTSWGSQGDYHKEEHVIEHSDGNWRFYSTGNWTGTIQLLYSDDNGQSWNEFYSTESSDTDTPFNPNTSGVIESKSKYGIKLKMIATQTSFKDNCLKAFMGSKNFETISYYKIGQFIKKDANSNYITKAYVDCIRNDMGDVPSSKNWRESVFSEFKGYPKTIGFYQNRLFISKDYILYGSKSNDFWDFYEPIEISDNDPVTMSLLSYKVNDIKNIVTVRSFFVFTQGGEFGISAEGALTQANKYLKQFSAHGSSNCLPVIVGSVVLFVDKSTNKIRALQYKFESDNYEAEDVSVLLEDLLENEEIVTTDYLPNTHEVLFLSKTNNGTIWVFKFFPEQQIYAWSHWNHANGRITNMCVVPNGPDDDLYIAVEDNKGKHIQMLSKNVFFDNVETYYGENLTELTTDFAQGEIVCVMEHYDKGIETHIEEVKDYGKIDLDRECDYVQVGSLYKSTATLLSPEIPTDKIGNNTTYYRKRPFKVHFVYRDSYGFKVGVEEDEKMSIEWQNHLETIDNEKSLTSGKKDVLIPSRYNGSARVSFVQDAPYPMVIENVSTEVDYGGK